MNSIVTETLLCLPILPIAKIYKTGWNLLERDIAINVKYVFKLGLGGKAYKSFSKIESQIKCKMRHSN